MNGRPNNSSEAISLQIPSALPPLREQRGHIALLLSEVLTDEGEDSASVLLTPHRENDLTDRFRRLCDIE